MSKPPVGTPEWMQAIVQQTSEEATAQLDGILEQAIERHGIASADTARMLAILTEVQGQSFRLGVGKGIDLVIKAMRHRRK